MLTGRHRATSRPNIVYSGKDGIDPIDVRSVPCTVVDFNTSLWSYHNCEMMFDAPFTVKTLNVNEESYMYNVLKLTPGFYVCRVKSGNFAQRQAQPHVSPNCRLELIERTPQHAIRRRNGCLCTGQHDLRLLICEDTNIELRLYFDQRAAVRIPTFHCMEVRSRAHVAIPFNTKIGSGRYRQTAMRYTLEDMHIVLKKIHFVQHWLETLSKNTESLIKIVNNPLFDIRKPLETREYMQVVQDISHGITNGVPESFISNSFFSVELFPSLRFPLISKTLVRELDQCIMSSAEISRHERVDSLQRSLRYINFVMIEYIEFKQKLSDMMVETHNKKKNEMWNTIRISV